MLPCLALGGEERPREAHGVGLATKVPPSSGFLPERGRSISAQNTRKDVEGFPQPRGVETAVPAEVWSPHRDGEGEGDESMFLGVCWELSSESCLEETQTRREELFALLSSHGAQLAGLAVWPVPTAFL